MWIMLNDAFFSIVKKDCDDDHLLVRARRSGDIEKVFGAKEITGKGTDYPYRAPVPIKKIARVLSKELREIDYGNFKNSVIDPELREAYGNVWLAMLMIEKDD